MKVCQKSVTPITLAIQRIKECIPTRRRLEKCPPLPELEGAFGIVGDKPFRVRAVFNEDFAVQIRERVWSKDQTITEAPNGSVELAFTATSKEQVLFWILGFGNSAELLEPASLRDMLREQAKGLWSIYR
ncbi:WYL domain-containing protein [Desulfovibrio sp. OttesenSCG-928-O18]|nr:WYL domain-containing protein [Desulfovibrio sp. OttesenSCG-928-O18]